MTELDNYNSGLLNKDTLDFEEENNQEEYKQVILKYDPDKINIVIRQLTIEQLLRRIEEKELDLIPDFKRHTGIWKDDVKSRLIESILIRIPLPAFYIDATDEDKWLVVDGTQRMFAFKQFVIDKNLQLSGLEYLIELEGKTYDELERKYQRRILETPLTVYLIEKGTPPEFKYNIFKRINTGGEPLSSQELRQALNPGKATHFLAKLAECEEFTQVVNLSELRKKRMDDREFILGFLAFTLTSYKDYIQGDRDTFLTAALSLANNISDEELNEIEKNFKKAMIAAFDIFGKNAFKRITPNQNILHTNKALFETLSVYLSQLSNEKIEILKQRKQELNEKLNYYLLTDKEFILSISSVSIKVKYRFIKIEKIIEEVLS